MWLPPLFPRFVFLTLAYGTAVSVSSRSQKEMRQLERWWCCRRDSERERETRREREGDSEREREGDSERERETRKERGRLGKREREVRRQLD